MLKFVSIYANPVGLIRLASSHFLHSNFRFWLLLSLRIVVKICRYLAFLLPFKALMIGIIPDRSFSILGFEVASSALSAVIVALAAAFFILQFQSNRMFNSVLARLFGHSGEEEFDSDTILEPAVERTLKATVEFHSGVFISAVLIAGTAVVFPASLPFFLVLYVVFFTSLALTMRTKKRPPFQYASFISVFSFISMVGVLGLFGAVIVFGGRVGALTGIFVFVSSRQIYSAMTDVARVLYTYRSAPLPPFLRGAAEDLENSAFSFAPEPPRYLRAESSHQWLELQCSSILGKPVRLVSSHWRQLSLRSLHMISVQVKHDDGSRQDLLAAIFDARNVSAFNRARAFHVMHPDCTVCLPVAGSRRGDDHSVILYGGETSTPADRETYVGLLPQVLGQLWSEPLSGAELDSALRNPFLDSINAASLDMLQVIADKDGDRDTIAYLCENLAISKQVVSSLPKALHNTTLSLSTTAIARDGSPKIVVWEQFSIEPIGCSLYLLPELDENQLSEALAYVQARRSDCRNIQVGDLRLAAAMFGLSSNLQNGAFTKALDRVRQTVQLLKQRRNDNNMAIARERSVAGR